jgi:hypothetical protein
MKRKCNVISWTNDANKDIASYNRISASVFLIMTFRSDDKSLISYKYNKGFEGDFLFFTNLVVLYKNLNLFDKYNIESSLK